MHRNIFELLEGKKHPQIFHIKQADMAYRTVGAEAQRQEKRSLVLMHVIIHTRGTPFVPSGGVQARACAVPTPFQPWPPPPSHPFFSVSHSLLSVVLHF